ncbi:orexin receptor type 2-like [Littorina saxatilis]|uniref:orexin receptor type 2-like n=1 Tax=Littorina saxatilis TaxID=31220 RepID=UPI0038B63122
MLIVFFILGVVGNALAFYIYYQKKDKTTSTLFILSLAATDFFTCLIGIPYTLAAELLKYKLHYDFVCKCYMFLMTFNIPLSAFIMVAVGFDRYFCICHPFLHVMTVKRAKICLICLTLLASVFGIITALGYGVYYLDIKEVPVSLTSSGSSLATLVGSTTMTTVVDGRADTGSVYSVLNGTSNIVPVSAGDSLYEATTRLLSTATVTPPGGDARVNNTDSEEEPEYIMLNKTVTIYFGTCVGNPLIYSNDFHDVYQKIYAALFLVCFLVLALLYALIYRSILIRRAWKAKRKRMSCYASTVNGPETAPEETQLTNINNGNNGTETTTTGRVPTRTSVALRDRMLYANIKTAAMLFVVTVVFVISFLPSWLIGLKAVGMNYIIFYIFFLNNVANPFIYAFMNRTFRDDLRSLLKRMKNRLSGW